MQPITKTCLPRPDVLEGGLADNHFAAQLDQVVRNPDDYPVYGNADEFFALSYPTQGLKDMMARAFGRLSGAKVEGTQHGVIRSETSFGGGKTHSLIAVTHVAKGAKPPNLSEFVDPSLVPDDCQVAAIVADTLDPVNGLTTNGFLTHTMWGELGAQLGASAFEALKRSDEERTAPGKETLESAIGDRPTIVIIDEIAQHLRQLSSSGNADVRRIADAVPVFLKNLFELAAGRTNIVVILTLATRQDAFGKETDEDWVAGVGAGRAPAHNALPMSTHKERCTRIERVVDRLFEGEETVLHLIERIVAPLGLRVDGSSPWVDARLPYGSRVRPDFFETSFGR